MPLVDFLRKRTSTGTRNSTDILPLRWASHNERLLDDANAECKAAKPAGAEELLHERGVA